MMLAISSLSVGCRNIVLLLSFEKSSTCLSNILRLLKALAILWELVIVLTLSKESAVGTLDATVLKK